jgi:hypothetical protein
MKKAKTTPTPTPNPMQSYIKGKFISALISVRVVYDDLSIFYRFNNNWDIYQLDSEEVV